MATRPNFLLVITDQHRADYLGCYGHPVLKTPNIDSIAGRGMRFTRFYVATPVCMPNRATLMTGRMPSVHGVRSNGSPLSLQSNTFVDALRAGGYATTLVGKSHLHNFTGFRTVLGHCLFRDQQDDEPDAERYQYQIIQIANNRNEIRNQVEGESAYPTTAIARHRCTRAHADSGRQDRSREPHASACTPKLLFRGAPNGSMPGWSRRAGQSLSLELALGFGAIKPEGIKR